MPHHFRNDDDEDAVAIQELRPALGMQQFFETYFGLAERGELDEHANPSLLRMAVVAAAFADEIRLVRPPWPLQRGLRGAGSDRAAAWLRVGRPPGTNQAAGSP